VFTYLNPAIRERLIEEGKLVRVDARGQRLDPRSHPPAGALSLNIMGPIPLPLGIGEHPTTVDWYAAVRSSELDEVEELAGTLREKGGQHLFSALASSMAVNSVLVFGEPRESQSPLVRVHSSCLTGDVFGSKRCECGPQLWSASDRIAQDPNGGLLIYMAGHEGRGIGLWAKAATYLLQDQGEDTYQANRSLGLPDDSRDFADAAALLHYFLGPFAGPSNRPTESERTIRLLTNNPKKIDDLTAQGIASIEPVKHVTGVSDSNRRYLSAKRDWGHRIGPKDLDDPHD
jgi:GTP cyclohydrolase II